MIVGPLFFARAFLRDAVATGLAEPDGLTHYSWPSESVDVVDMWPPLDMDYRSSF